MFVISILITRIVADSL